MMFRGVFGFALCANQKKEEGNITSRLSFCLQLTADTQGAYLYRRLSLSPRQTRGAAMSLTAALSGFLVVLLSVSAVQGQSDWSVTYNRTSICAVKGSTVEISCTYTHPYGTYYKVIKSFWFREGDDKAPVDLRTDSDYTGRVQYLFTGKVCSLRITDLRESDSAQYKFRFITNQQVGSFTGSPGVFLSVSALQVQVIRSSEYKRGYYWAELKCHSSRLSDHRSYVWTKNEQIIRRGTSFPISTSFYPADRVSCAVKGYKECPSPSVYAPKLPSVSVSPSAEIEEGSSVTLTCSSDANPAAQYTWYKEEEESPKASGQNFTIADVRLEHSGNYSCEAQNTRGSQNSTVLLTVVPGAVQSTAAAVTAAVLLPLVFLSACLWIRTKRTSNGSSEPELRADGREQCVGGQGKPEEQDEPQYASVHFSNNQADPMYSNNRAAQPHRHSEEVTEYAVVRFHRVSPALRAEETREDASVLYSTINKTR